MSSSRASFRHRHRALAVAAALLSACALAPVAEPPPAPPPPQVSSDGRTLTAGGETWLSPDGVTFFVRAGEVHLVSLVPGQVFDRELALEPGAKPVWPAGLPFDVAPPHDGQPGELRWRTGAATSVEELVRTGQLYAHDDHLHVTHRYKNADWQALYAYRADDSPLPPIRREVAANVLATLVDWRIPAGNEKETVTALARVNAIIAKARRALEAGLTARQIDSVLDHNYEIVDGGRTLEIEGQVFHAGPGLVFAYCTDHFHVESQQGRWAQPIELTQDPGHFSFPPSIFYTVAADGMVTENAISSRWQQLAQSGQVRFTRDHWHITEAYANPRFKKLLDAMDDPKKPDPLRESARGRVFDILRLRLELGSEQEFESKLAVIDQVIDRHFQEFQKEERRKR